MDESTNTATVGQPDGFPGQRLKVLPRPLVQIALRAPITRHLLVTDAGYFPRAHHHDKARRRAEEHIIIVCASGMGECVLDGRTHAVRAGDVLVVPAGAPHRYRADESDPWTIWWVHLTGTASTELLAATRATRESPVFRLADATRAMSLVATIVTRMEADETTSSMVATAGVGWHLLTMLASEGRPLGQGERRDPIPEVMAHIRTNLAHSLTVAELASMAGFSNSHFSALFRKATGYGALEYQTRLRMSVARTLLDTTERTVGSIAAEVGYPDGLYFSRQFRRIHQLSPSQYRSRRASLGR